MEPFLLKLGDMPTGDLFHLEPDLLLEGNRCPEFTIYAWPAVHPVALHLLALYSYFSSAKAGQTSNKNAAPACAKEASLSIRPMYSSACPAT